MITLPGHPSSPVFSEMNVAQLYVLCCGLSTTVFVPFPLKTIAFIVCPSIYTSGFSLWYLQTNQYPTRKVYGRDILMYLFVFYVSFIFSIFVIITQADSKDLICPICRNQILVAFVVQIPFQRQAKCTGFSRKSDSAFESINT